MTSPEARSAAMFRFAPIDAGLASVTYTTRITFGGAPIDATEASGDCSLRSSGESSTMMISARLG
jgi:hypothetical protein